MPIDNSCSPLRVAVIGPSLGLGGMERALAEMSGALAEAGANVVCVPIFERQRYMELRREVTLHESLLGDSNKFRLFRAIWRLRRTLVSHRVQVVLGVGVFASALVGLASVGCPLVYAASERTSPSYRWPLTVRALVLTAFFINRPSLYITQSAYAASQAINRRVRADRIIAVPNVVRSDKFSAHSLEREPLVLVVGRSGDWQKGMDVARKAWRMVDDKRSWGFYIVGTKDNIDHVTDLADPKNDVNFVEATNNISQWYARASIFVLPSRGEGFPNALVEAMASGLAVISTEYHPGVHEIIESGRNGIVVPVNDPLSLSHSISLLMRDAGIRCRLGKNARLKTREFAPAVIGRRLLDELSQCKRRRGFLVKKKRDASTDV